jgi:tRNA pseudouridine55 synthase
MPKVTRSSFPVSALFGVVKPSGPTSMSIVNDIQQLVARSRLFVDAEKLEKMKGKKLDRWRGKAGREAVKIGQGGTLDPLADGVLGQPPLQTKDLFPETIQYPSDRSW